MTWQEHLLLLFAATLVTVLISGACAGFLGARIGG
jgi:hypothetical protein